MAIRIGHGLIRRKLLTSPGSTALITGVSGIARPYLSRAADRPAVSHGVQSGDASTDSGMVWARADRASRMQVEISTVESFTPIHSGVLVDALPGNDYT